MPDKNTISSDELLEYARNNDGELPSTISEPEQSASDSSQELLEYVRTHDGELPFSVADSMFEEYIRPFYLSFIADHKIQISLMVVFTAICSLALLSAFTSDPLKVSPGEEQDLLDYLDYTTEKPLTVRQINLRRGAKCRIVDIEDNSVNLYRIHLEGDGHNYDLQYAGARNPTDYAIVYRLENLADWYHVSYFEFLYIPSDNIVCAESL